MIEIRPMLEDELDSVHAMLNRAFPNTPKNFFHEQATNDPNLKPEDTRILLVDGRVAACVRIYYRTIRCGEKEIPMGGIGDVGTDPEFQGSGYASRLMEDALNTMRRKGVLVSFLFTRFNSFYTRFGYLTLPTFELRLQAPAAKDLEVFLPDPEKELEALMEIHDSFDSRFTGPVVRDRDYWLRQLRFPRVAGSRIYAAREKGRIAAYVRARNLPDSVHILEYGALPDSGNLIPNLTAHAARMEGGGTVTLVHLPGSEKERFASWKAEAKENTALMVRLVDLKAVRLCRPMFAAGVVCFWESDRF